MVGNSILKEQYVHRCSNIDKSCKSAFTSRDSHLEKDFKNYYEIRIVNEDWILINKDIPVEAFETINRYSY